MMGDFVVPGHSTVVERLRRRIELIRRHHSNCENRYEKSAMERSEMEKQWTFALHQRCQHTKCKHKNKHRPATNADTAAQRGSVNGTAGKPNRNRKLIALQKTIKRKMEKVGSSLGHKQVNGFGDGYQHFKEVCVGDALTGDKNAMILPLSPMETKHSMSYDSILHNNQKTDVQVLNKADLKVSGQESNFYLKEMKQEPVDKILPCILPTGCVYGSNSLFPDLNLNDQDWTEIMEELSRSVPYEDIQELFSDNYGDHKDLEVYSTSAAHGFIPPDLASVKTESLPASATSAFDQDSRIGWPLVRPTSSGPSLHTDSPVVAPPTSPTLPVLQHKQQQPSLRPTRPLQNLLLPEPDIDLSPGQQLQQLASHEHLRAKILESQQQQHMVRKQQHHQGTNLHQQPNHSSPWRHNTPFQSQLGVTFSIEKTTSPPMHTHNFPKILFMPGQQPDKASSKSGTSAVYMQSGGCGNILSHTAAPTGPLSLQPNPGGQAAMSDYSYTKPLSHFEAGVQGVPKDPPTFQNKPNHVILNLMSHHQMQKQRPTLNFNIYIQHTLEPGSYPSTHTVCGNTMTPQPSGNSILGNHGNAAYMKHQQMQLMSQQQKQYLQRQILDEQEKKRKQQEQQLQRHLIRPPPKYKDKQYLKTQHNPFQQQQVSRCTGTSQPIVDAHSCGLAPGAQRMFSQTQGIMVMSQSSGPASDAASVASQADVNLPPGEGGLDVIYARMPLHSSHPIHQRLPKQTMTASYQQNILTAQKKTHLMSQPNAVILKQQQQLVQLPNSMPSTMANNMSSSIPASVQGALPTQSHTRQQQPPPHPGLQQAMRSQSGSSNGGTAVGFLNSGFQLQSGMTKLPNNAPFPQVGISVPARALAVMNPRQMMLNIKQQRTNNPAMGQQIPPSNQQPPQQGQPASQNEKVLPNLGPFSQAQTVPSCTTGLQTNQTYQINRTASPQLKFGCNGPLDGSLSGFSVDTDLDSLLKNNSTQEWMDDIDELLASHQ